jgi:hypothetical protein
MMADLLEAYDGKWTFHNHLHNYAEKLGLLDKIKVDPIVEVLFPPRDFEDWENEQARHAAAADQLASQLKDNGIQQELSKLVLDGSDCLSFEPLIVAGEFIFPKFLDEWVFDLPDHPCPVPFIRQHPVHGIRPGPLEDPAVLAIAKQTSLTPAQVLLAWGIQRGTAVLTTAKTLDRARENYNISEIPETAVDEINRIQIRSRLNSVVATGVPGFIAKGG